MFERTRVRTDGLRVDTVIDFQNAEKEKFFTDLYEWLESVTLPDVEVTHSFIWGESKSFAYYTGDFFELPNNEGWDSCDCTLSSIRLQRVHFQDSVMSIFYAHCSFNKMQLTQLFPACHIRLPAPALEIACFSR